MLASVKIKYRPMPAESRFGLQSLVLNQEDCYTDEELQWRIAVLNTRKHSGLNQELLQTSNSWFAEDAEQAFIMINPNSWLLKPAFHPRQVLNRNDFHIPLINSPLLKWQRLGTMTRLIGDYLLIRNDQLTDPYLNQPMNYILLDLIQILKRLAMQQDANFVAHQLQLLSPYLRQVEIVLSPFKGSDRLFLAECRRTLEDIVQNDIEQQLQTQQLKVRVRQIGVQLNHIAELRHTVLHFALTANPVNPHPYWEQFITPADTQPTIAFPTILAKSCLKKEQAVASLRNCAGFKFIAQLPESLQINYQQGLEDLEEILRIQDLLQQLLAIFDQAGELFTVLQFREQIQHLLQHIEQFMQRSQQNILAVFNSNMNAYHQHIQDKQDLDSSWVLHRLLNHRGRELDHFITNQDNLARFITGAQDLQLANKELFQQLSLTQTILQEATDERQWELADSTKELVLELKRTMHGWINQGELPRSASEKSRRPLVAHPLFWPRTTQSPVKISTSPKMLAAQPPIQNDTALAELIFLLPIIVLFVYLIYSCVQQSKQSAIKKRLVTPHSPLLDEVQDKLTQAIHLSNEELQNTIEDYKDETRLIINAIRQGEGSDEQLHSLSEDLDELLIELKSF